MSLILASSPKPTSMVKQHIRSSYFSPDIILTASIIHVNKLPDWTWLRATYWKYAWKWASVSTTSLSSGYNRTWSDCHSTYDVETPSQPSSR